MHVPTNQQAPTHFAEFDEGKIVIEPTPIKIAGQHS
jgi:hypothetical protein